jgi:hypothetical protein
MRVYRSPFLLVAPCFFFFFVGTSAFAGSAWAESVASPGSSQSIEYSFSVTPVYQSQSDVEGGGKFRVSRYLLLADAAETIQKTLRLGVNFTYDFEDYGFSELRDFAVPKPWDQVHRIGLGAQLSSARSRNWRFLLAPSIGFSGEGGAEWEKAFIYGGVISASRVINQDLTLGAGVGIFEQLEKLRVFPYLVVNWKINDRLRLSNPLRAGPVGSAGLELAYAPNDTWELGAGGAYRSSRFRLREGGAVPNGIGEVKFFPVFARLSRKIGPHFQCNLYLGASFLGKLSIGDADGRKLDSAEYDAAPFAALNVTGRF